MFRKYSYFWLLIVLIVLSFVILFIQDAMWSK